MTEATVGVGVGLVADQGNVIPLKVVASRPAALWRGLRSPMLLVLIDVLAAAGALVYRGHIVWEAAVYLSVMPIWLAALGNYRDRPAGGFQSDLMPLLGALGTPLLALALINRGDANSLFHTMPLVVGFVVAGRAVAYPLQRVARARSNDAQPTLIVGAGQMGCQVAEALLQHPEYGMRPVGFIDGFPNDAGLPLPIVGDIDTFDQVIKRVNAKRVIVAFGSNREEALVEVLRASAEAQIEVHILPRLFELGVTSAGPEFDLLWGLPLQHVRRAALRNPAWRTKRILDVLVSGAALLVLSPVLAITAVAVRFSSPGPVLFRQKRVGQRGEVVEIYKFRSMRVSDDADTRWASRHDDRVTGVGRFIRASSLDELPQLINVLKGDMSLVGPRPERPHFADQFNQQVFHYNDRLRVPVGLTGWAQVHGLRGDTSIEERARFDNYYIEHWSIWFDLVILVRTVGQVLREIISYLPGQ